MLKPGSVHGTCTTNSPFSIPNTPAISSALLASFGRFVNTTDAAMVSGASALSSSSGIRSSGELDILGGAARLEPVDIVQRSLTEGMRVCVYGVPIQ
jgi:hypothetical protein